MAAMLARPQCFNKSMKYVTQYLRPTVFFVLWTSLMQLLSVNKIVNKMIFFFECWLLNCHLSYAWMILLPYDVTRTQWVKLCLKSDNESSPGLKRSYLQCNAIKWNTIRCRVLQGLLLGPLLSSISKWCFFLFYSQKTQMLSLKEKIQGLCNRYPRLFFCPWMFWIFNLRNKL